MVKEVKVGLHSLEDLFQSDHTKPSLNQKPLQKIEAKIKHKHLTSFLSDRSFLGCG